MVREIPIDILEGFKVPDAALLCRRGDTWTVERNGSSAGAFISGCVGASERLYPEPNGQLVLSDDGGATAAARISAIPSGLFSIAEKIREIRDVPAEESYEMVLGKAVGSHRLINLGNLASIAIKAAQPAVPSRPDRHIVLASGPVRICELADDIGTSWAREAISRIADPSHFPDVEIPSGLTDEILDSAWRAAGEDRAAYNRLRSDIGFAQGVIRDAFGRDLESEAEFYDSSATDNVCSMLETIDTMGRIVILEDTTSGLCEYLYSDTESFTRAQPRNVGEFASNLACGRYRLGDDGRDFELVVEDGKLILDESPSMAHSGGKYGVLFIAKSLSDRVIAMEDAELAREMSRLRVRRGSPAENLVVRMAEMSGDIAGVERDICSIFGWDFCGNGRMESLDDLMEAVELESAQAYGRSGRDKA